jgi:peptide/nickel transport system substrate-binding protein
VSFSTEVVYLGNCYEPLIYANPPGSTEPFSPALATSWEVSKDGLEWTFHLRKGVTFHDGTAFDAAAVKFSIDRTKKINLGAAYLWAPVKEVQVVDDYTVRFVTSYPVALDRIAAASSGAWIFSPATAGKDQKWWDEGREDGTGPWILQSYKPNEEVVFVRNTKWWGGWKDNQFQKIVVKMVADAGTQRQMLEAGEIDYAGRPPLDQIDALAANPNIAIGKSQSWNSYLMFFNTAKKPLDNVKVRQALSYAVPYQDLITVGANGLGTQSKGPVPVGLWPNASGDLFQYTYDLEKAKQLLAEAGYPNGGFTLNLTYASENTYEQGFAPLIKEAFAKIGVTVNIQPLLWNQQWAKAKGAAAERQDLFVLLWWPSLPDGYDNLSSMFRTETTPAWNLAYWYSKEYDTTLDEAYKLSATDMTASQQAYTKAMTMLIDQAPAAYLFDAVSVSARLKTIKMDKMAINPNYPGVLFWSHVTL